MADDLTLAQRVRAKYPGAYAGLSDADLEAKVRAKYPGVYDNVRSTEPEAPEKSDGRGALATGGALATLAAAIPATRAVAERVATSPLVGGAVSKIAAGAGALNVGKLGYDLAHGRGLSAIMDAAKNEALRQGGKLAYRAAAPAAEALGTGAAAFGAGGLAGLAGTTGFLGALQHDANRTVPMDYTKRNLTEDIARVLGGAGATDAQMDDPNHPAFRADDAETVVGGEPPSGGLALALLRLLRGGA